MPMNAPPCIRSPRKEGARPNEHLQQYIVSALRGGLMGDGDQDTTTELDSHVNMAVVGQDVRVISVSRTVYAWPHHGCWSRNDHKNPTQYTQ